MNILPKWYLDNYKSFRNRYFPYYCASNQPEPDGKRYVFLREFFLFKGLQINNLVRPNAMPEEYHSHPVSFFSIILRGGYTHEIYDPRHNTKKIEEIKWWNFMPYERLHKVLTVKPNTWTLVFANSSNNQGGLWGCVRGKLAWIDLSGTSGAK